MRLQSRSLKNTSIQPHSGDVDGLRHTFRDVHDRLLKGSIPLQTDVGTPFEARSATARDGRPVLKFFQRGQEYARAYECCWGRYYNCNRTRIGMYCKALDRELS